MPVPTLSFLLGLVVIGYLFTFVVFAILRIVTGVSIQRVGYPASGGLPSRRAMASRLPYAVLDCPSIALHLLCRRGAAWSSRSWR